MTEKAFKIVDGDISDGYHTFGELYDHRCVLFIAWLVSDGFGGEKYYVEEHFAGWDLLVGYLGEGLEAKQISYHVPAKFRHLYEGPILKISAGDHMWDGHTSTDVLARIMDWVQA